MFGRPSAVGVAESPLATFVPPPVVGAGVGVEEADRLVGRGGVNNDIPPPWLWTPLPKPPLVAAKLEEKADTLKLSIPRCCPLAADEGDGITSAKSVRSARCAAIGDATATGGQEMTSSPLVLLPLLLLTAAEAAAAAAAAAVAMPAWAYEEANECAKPPPVRPEAVAGRTIVAVAPTAVEEGRAGDPPKIPPLLVALWEPERRRASAKGSGRVWDAVKPAEPTRPRTWLPTGSGERRPPPAIVAVAPCSGSAVTIALP